jgi:hypothetical protein
MRTAKLTSSQSISALRAHPSCTDFLHSFLELIEEHMIVAKPEERADCQMVLDELQAMCGKIKHDPDEFAMRPTPLSHRPKHSRGSSWSQFWEKMRRR